MNTFWPGKGQELSQFDLFFIAPNLGSLIFSIYLLDGHKEKLGKLWFHTWIPRKWNPESLHDPQMVKDRELKQRSS